MEKLAIEAARRAGHYLLGQFHHFDRRRARFKSKHEIVTPADLASEKMILDLIKKRFPSHEIYSEEKGRTPQRLRRSDYLWVIDPLDGTTNFFVHHPLFAVSIALVRKGEPVLGVVYAPYLEELYVAQKGQGVTLNNRRIHVSSRQGIQDSFLSYCHSYKEADIKRAIRFYEEFKNSGFETRQLGAASLELAYVAAGRIEAVIIPGALLYDVAAGILVVREAGGLVTDFKGRPWQPASRDMLATNSKVHHKILKVLPKIHLI